ncbi:hypothetical protein AHAS_Ahas07G0126800 [Arachis hypogaea]
MVLRPLYGTGDIFGRGAWQNGSTTEERCTAHYPKELPEGDDFVFGFPTRFGMMTTQFKSFLDATRSLWLTAITQLVHHGMLFVPIRCTFSGGMFEMNEVKGGSPYSAGTYAGGDGSRQQLNLSWSKHSTKASILPPSLRSSRKNEAIHKLGY